MVSISPSEVPKIFLLPPLDLPPAANLFILQSSNTNGFLLLAALHLSYTLKRNSLEVANLHSSLCMIHSFIRLYPGEKFRRDICWYNNVFFKCKHIWCLHAELEFKFYTGVLTFSFGNPYGSFNLKVKTAFMKDAENNDTLYSPA